MKDEDLTLTDAQEEALRYIYEHGGEILGATEIAQARGTSRQAAHRLINRIPEPLLDVDTEGQRSKISLTSAGLELARELTPYGSGDVDREGFERLHGISVVVDVKGGGLLPDDWMARIQEREDANFLKTGPNDWIMAKDIWVLRFHKDRVTFQLRDGAAIKADSSEDAFLELSEKIREIGGWVEDVADVDLDYRRVKVRRSELAFERHHLAVLVDRLPGLELDDIVVEDEDLGRDVVKMDKSPGFPELETMTGERAEEIGQVVEDELRQYAGNRDAVRWRHSFEREGELQGVHPVEAVHSIRQVPDLEDELEEIRERQDNLLELKREERKTREEEKKTREALASTLSSQGNKIESLESLQVRQLQLLEKVTEAIEEIRRPHENQVDGSEAFLELAEDETGRDSGESEGADMKLGSRPEGSGRVELKSLELEPGDGNMAPSAEDLETGMRLMDLREDRLLVLESFETKETELGFEDVARLRIAGTRKTWHWIPRRELARLLRTGRFEVVDW